MKNIEQDKEFIKLWKKIDISEIKNLVEKAIEKNKNLKPNIPENIYINTGKPPKVLVYTYKNSFNFKLINSIFSSLFPPNLEVKISDLVPLEFNSLSKYDLLVLGVGETIPASVFQQPDFQDFIYGAKKSIGISNFSENRLEKDIGELVNNLDFWFLSFKKNYEDFKNNFKNIEYLGLWQIMAFPFTNWEIDGEVKILKNLNINNETLINTIQKYRKVHSEQPYPLISAVNSAEYISYEDKMNENIKDVLFEIFEKQIYPKQKFKVEREKVLNYRENIVKNINNLKQKIEEMVYE